MIQLESIRNIVKPDLERVDELLMRQMGSEIPLIQKVSQYIFQGGGKRLRPLLVILGANLFNYQGEHHHLLASVVELIHTATLLHDDVVDQSVMRRGRETANTQFGNNASVLVGDFLYSRAFQMMVEVGNLQVFGVLAQAGKLISEGEVMQLSCSHDPFISETRYLEIISRKTAALFEAAAQLGAIITKRSSHEIATMASFGHHAGIAFQMIDDALDYGASNADIGKNIGDDLAEGKMTLPLIYIMKNGSETERQLIEQALKQKSTDQLEEIQKAIATTKAIEYTYESARRHVRKAKDALEYLPDSSWRQVLQQFADFAIARMY